MALPFETQEDPASAGLPFETSRQDSPNLLEKTGKFLGGTVAGTADFVAPVGTAFGGYAAVENQIRKAIGMEHEPDVSKVVDKYSKFNPSELAIKLGIPEEYLHNWAYEATQKPLELLGEAGKFVGEHTPGEPLAKTIADVGTQFAGVGLGLKGASKFAESGTGKVSKETAQARKTYPSEAELNRQQAAEEATKTDAFKGAQQEPLPFEQQSPYGAMKPEDIATDPYSQTPYNKTLTDKYAAEERGLEPAVQADWVDQTQVGLQLKKPMPDDLPPKVQEEGAPLSDIAAAEAIHTPEWTDMIQRMSEKSALPYGEPPNLPPVKSPGSEPATIEYKPHIKGPEASVGKPRLNAGTFRQGGAVNFGFSEAVAKSWDKLREEIKKIDIHDKNFIEKVGDLSKDPHNPEAVWNLYTEIYNKENYPNSLKSAVWELSIDVDKAAAAASTAKIYKFPSGERGSVDPSVFLEGLSRLLGRTPKTLEGAKGMLEAKLEGAMGTRDTFMAPAYREKLQELGQLQIAGKERGSIGVRDTAKLDAEKPLVEAAKKGEPGAFEKLYEATRPRLEKFARKYKSDEGWINDMVQETMMTAWQELKNFKGESQFNTWATNILKNKVLMDFRSNKFMREISDTERAHLDDVAGKNREQFDNPSNILEERQQKEGINRAWEKLDPDTRQILELRELHDQSYENIAELLGMPVGTVKSRIARGRDELKGLVKQETNGRPKAFYGGPGGKQRGAIGFEPKELEKKAQKGGFAKAVKDQHDQFDISPENLQDVVKATPKEFDPANVKDLDKGGDKIMANMSIDKTMSILTEKTGALGKVIKWVVDNRREIDRKAGVIVRDSISKATGKESSWAAMKRTGEAGHVQLRDLVDKWIDNIGKKELTRDDFKSDKQLAAYREISGIMEKTRQDLNTARSKFPGLKSLEKIESYVPATWEGDYFTIIRNSLGETVDMHSFTSRRDAIKMQEALQKAHPDLDVHWVEKGENKFGLKNLSAFEETMRRLDQNSPEFRAVRATYLDILSKRSMGGHAAHKTGVTGFKGSEGGKKGIKNFEQVFDQYIRGAYNYIGNLEKQALKEQLGGLDPKVRAAMPEGLKYMDEYLSMAKGEAIKQEPIIRGVAEWASSWAGYGRSGPQRLLSNLSGIATLFWLTTPRFYLANMVQSLNSLPKMMEIAGRDGLARNPLHSMWEGITQSLKPDAAAKEAAVWAEKNGYLESALVEMLNLSLTDVHRSKIGAIGDIASWSQQKWEHHAVRLPSFLGFEYQLRDSVPNKIQRFQRAAEMMDYYMVHYDKASSPLAYEKLGMLGDVARPLKQYPHNAWGQFFEFLQTGRDQGRYGGLATSLGVQATVAGVKGVVLVAEATAIVTAINAIFNTDIPTPEKMLLGGRAWMKGQVKESSPLVKKGVGNLADALVYGGYSTALGVDVSSSVNAPGVVQMFSAPPAQFATNMLVTDLNYLIKKTQGTATPADEMAAWTASTPNMARGFIEELYTIPGQPVPRPSEQMKGNYQRTPMEHWLSGLTSLKSIDNAAADDLVRVTKATLARDHKQQVSAINAIVGQVREGKDIDEGLIKMYLEEGGSIKELPNAIKNAMKGQALTYEERQLQGSMTPAKIHRLKQMQLLIQEHQDRSGGDY